MALSDDITEIKERLATIEQMFVNLNGKRVWSAIGKLRIGMAVIYAAPVITVAVWGILKAIGKL